METKIGRRYPVVWITILTCLILLAMIYTFSTGRSTAERYAPLVHAAMKIKLETTTSHLWFEELITGDRFIDIKEVWSHLDQAEWYARAMLEGGENEIGKLTPLKDLNLRNEIKQTLAGIRSLRNIAEERWKSQSLSGVGSDIDQQFDSTFNEFLNTADTVEKDLQHVMNQQLYRFRIVQGLSFVIVTLSGLFVVMLLQRHESRRTNDLLSLQDREKRLSASEKRYRTLFDKNNDAIFLVDKDSGHYLDANQAAEKLSGCTLDQLKTLTTHEVCPDGAVERLKKIAGSDKKQSMGIVTYVRPDDSKRTARLNVIPLDAGHVIGIARDITDELVTEKQLRRAQKMDAIGQLTGGIAHDFNNILGIILGNVDLLKFQITDNPKAMQRVETIKNSAQRAANLTKQLLGFSRSQAAQNSPASINHVIDEMESLINRIVTPEVTVEYQLFESLWLTSIDTDDFRDVTLNLIHNAHDAMSHGGLLTLKTENRILDDEFCRLNPGLTPGEYVLLSVGDDGDGITPEALEHIYEPFFTTKPQGKGTGLGLAMVFGFVKRSRGYITVTSEVGKGTTFMIYLPRTRQQESVPEPVDEHTLVLPQGSETILVVEDEQGLLDLARESLQKSGYRVLTACDTRQALMRLAEEPKIDLLFSDVVMPGDMDGYELAKQVTLRRPDIKVLLTSGYAEKVFTQSRQITTNAHLLAKPYSQADLMQRIREILGEPEMIARSLS